MITADTITDEQIRALQREAREIAAACAVALEAVSRAASPFGKRRLKHIADARARCAEILNAREGTR